MQSHRLIAPHLQVKINMYILSELLGSSGVSGGWLEEQSDEGSE
jgi:hypothetical protein